MPRISRAEFERDAQAVEQAALATEGVDAFCSGPDWMFAAKDAWAPETEPWLWRLEAGYLCFLRERAGLLTVLTPFDRMWGYSCPILGPPGVASEFAAALDEARCQLAIVTGLMRDSDLWNALVEALSPTCDLGVGDPQHRRQAHLEGYWERRPRKLRQELRRMERRAEERGLIIEAASGPPDDLYRRVLEVERRSWKGPKGTGLIHKRMRDFYEVLFRRLQERDRLRLRFARIDGDDVGYIAGGTIGDQYRGLQFSFDDSCRELGLGNLMQAAEIRALAEEGFSLYDLGIDIDYKARWADERIETSTLIVRPR